MGILAAIGAGIASFLAVDVGVGVATAGIIGSIGALGVVGAGAGALGGGALSAIEGRPILSGALHGAEAGGLVGLGAGAGGAIAGGLGFAAGGFGAIAGSALGGAAGGALGGEATGGDPLTGAAFGALSGGFTGYQAGLDAAAATSGPLQGPTVGGNTLDTVDLTQLPTSGPLQGPTISGGTLDAVNPANVAQEAAGAIPVPPVPPALGASGNPLGGYPSLDAAQAASSADTITAAGGIVPQQSGIAGVAQSLGLNGPTSGTLGYQIDPTLGVAPGTAAGAGPDGTFTAAQGAAAPAGTAPPAGTDWSRLSSDPIGTLGSAASNNPKAVLGALGLGYSALKGNQPVPGESALTEQANTLLKQSNQLTQDALTKALPPGAQAQLSQASNSMKAHIRSQYSQMGLSGSTMESQAMQSADQMVSSQGYSIMQSLLSQGLSESQAANSMLSQLMSMHSQRDNALSGAVGNFAGSIAGGARNG